MTTLKKHIVLLMICALMGATSCSMKKSARATIKSASGSTLTGDAVFEEADGAVKMTLTLKNATPGTHAVHLHESGDCSAPDAKSAGGHWNPTNQQHGNRAGGGSFHRGDVANVDVAEDGTTTFEITVSDWTIGGDPNSDILGKAVIIHADADDFVSQSAGNAGARVGCGVIEK